MSASHRQWRFVRAVALAAAGLVLAAGAVGAQECPPARPAPICLVVTVRAPGAANAAELRRRLRAEGIRATGDARVLHILARPSQVRRTFGVRVRYVLTGGGSGGMVCEPRLHRIPVPARYRDVVASIRFDPQLC